MGMRERFQEPLINPTWDQIVEREPLVAFSHYLSERVRVLLGVAHEIVENLDSGFAEGGVDTGRVGHADTLMWLWTLGAYEVVRTMCQARVCFSDAAFKELDSLKKGLAAIRMPAAKMEKAGKTLPVSSSRSSSGWDMMKRDLIVSDPEAQNHVYARTILAEFDRVFSAMTKGDVLARHEDSYGLVSQPNVDRDGC